MRVERDLGREIMHDHILGIEKRPTSSCHHLSHMDENTRGDSQDLGRFFGADPDDAAEIELLEEGEVQLGRLGGAVEA